MKTDAIVALVRELIAALRQWGAAIAAYFAGRSDGAAKAEERHDKANHDAREDQDERDQEFERQRRDSDRRKRVRDAFLKARDDE